MSAPIGVHWSKIPHSHPALWADMTAHFDMVHTAHVQRVQRNLNLLADYYESHNMFDVSLQLAQRAVLHDQSKLYEPEYVPYVWRVYRTEWLRNNKQDQRFFVFYSDHTLDQAIRDAVVHHVTHNRHHPEWHLDPDEMSLVDIGEMVCDWYAMSQELGSHIEEWVMSVVPRRYHFGKKISLIHQIVTVLKSLDVNDKIQRQ